MFFEQFGFYQNPFDHMFLTLQETSLPATEKVKGRNRIRECNLINLCIPLFNTESVTIRALFNSAVYLCVTPITYIIMCCVDWPEWNAVLYGYRGSYLM